jgi:hypothetical protein
MGPAGRKKIQAGRTGMKMQHPGRQNTQASRNAGRRDETQASGTNRQKETQAGGTYRLA